MAKKKSAGYLRRQLDPVKKNVDRVTSTIDAIDANLFTDLNALSEMMPDVFGIYRYESIFENEQPRYHGDMHELLFVTRGKGKYELNGKKFPIKPRDVVVIKPGDLHRYTKGSAFECITIHFTFKDLKNVKGSKTRKPWPRKKQDEFLTFLTRHYPHLHVFSLVEGSQVLNKAVYLYQEFQRPGAGSDLLIRLYFLEILVLLARNVLYSKKGDQLNTRQVTTRDGIMVRQIKDYIYHNYGKPLKMEDLFKNYYLHPNYCRNIFKKTTGKSVSEYILERRMDVAKRMLVDTDKTIAAIAEATGFEEYYYFLRVFKKFHGYSPGALRKDPSR